MQRERERDNPESISNKVLIARTLTDIYLCATGASDMPDSSSSHRRRRLVSAFFLSLKKKSS
jgi:hypothetical protein